MLSVSAGIESSCFVNYEEQEQKNLSFWNEPKHLILSAEEAENVLTVNTRGLP